MEQQDLQPTRPETSFIKTFPCSGCGAKLSFAPGSKTLKCQFCGTENAIPESGEGVEELDFATYLKALEGRADTEEVETVKCQSCGAEQTLKDNLFASNCSFCHTPIVSKGYANRRIKPKLLVPFAVDTKRAQEAFRRWIRGRWLAPNDLKRYAQSDAGLTGMYLPFWTYDCNTWTEYQGERGDDYYTDESYTEGGQTRTRRTRHTRWTGVSGTVSHFHDDVLVMASKTLSADTFGSIGKWNLKGLVPYQPEFVSGFQAEAYQVDLKQGFPIAKATIDAQVQQLIRRDIGGDQQRIHRADTRYSNVTFKHVLLPVWISAYRYRDKPYRFLINGQSGEVSGESPKSWIKVALLTILILFVVFVLLVLFSN
jgi:LSD1 subclass zinc finger protein